MEHTRARALSPPAPHGRLGFVVHRSGTVARFRGHPSSRRPTGQWTSRDARPPCLGPEPGWRARREGPREGPRAVLSLSRSSAFPGPRPPAPGAPPANWADRPPFAAAPPAAALPLLAAARPPGSPPLSREVPAAVPRSPQPHRREAPALARAVTPARPAPTVCRAALSASAAVSRDGPGSPLHRLSDHPREHGCRAILHFPKTRWGGRDLLWRWSVPRLFPIQCGPHFISGRGLGEILDEKPRGAAWRPPPRGPRQCRQLISRS
jgi:hypothetical protein